MLATLALLGGLLAPAQVMSPTPPGVTAPPLPPGVRREPDSVAPAKPVAPGEWVMTSRLAPGQELVYRGSYSEQVSGDVQVNHAYRFETRALVLEATPRGIDLAVLTLFNDDPVPGRPPVGRLTLKVPVDSQARSARIERILLDPRGRPVPPKGVALTVPLEGPATLECGFTVPVPATRLGLNRPWLVQEVGRPDTTWKVIATNVVGGESCLRLHGVQQSADWEQPRPDRVAWRRQDVVWLSVRSGVAQKVERRIEHRLPGATRPARAGVLSYELQSNMQYPAALIVDRRREIDQTLRLQDSARPFLDDPGGNGARIDILLARSKTYLESQSVTPYREALVALRARLEAARRGEKPAELLTSVQTPTPGPPPPRIYADGPKVPDFLAADVSAPDRTVSLRQLRGQPVLLFFYNPDSRTLPDLIQTVEDIERQFPAVRVIALALAKDMDRVSRQRKEKGWKFPVVNGGPVRTLYGVDCTPTLLMIDTHGSIRATVVGWGAETPAELQTSFRNWLRP